MSFPKETVALIKKRVLKGSFASTSEYIRHLIRLENTGELAKEFAQARKDFKAGRLKELKNPKDLRD